MKPPRLSLAAVVFLVCLLAVNFGIIRAFLVDHGEGQASTTFLMLLPVINVLLVLLFRIRKKARRTPASVGFLLTSMVVTALLAFVYTQYWDPTVELLSWILVPAINKVERLLTRLVGKYDGSNPNQYLRYVIFLCFELVIPAILLSSPPVLLGLSAARFAKKAWPLPKDAAAKLDPLI
jgi:hypothetical protein